MRTGNGIATATSEPRRRRRRRVRSPAFSAAAAAVAIAGNGGGRRSGPTTPLLRWKFDGDAGGGQRNADAAISARKLAAGIWHLQRHCEVTGDSFRRASAFKPNPGPLHIAHDCDHQIFNRHANTNNECPRAISALHPKDMLLKSFAPSRSNKLVFPECHCGSLGKKAE